ncbi:DUF2341 domain-containing protein [Candidatus Gottesmanbacteria bacterium]|nr:DUF2341 domain-containing protein [Candidatus Gottesmanbacteria bacterium]
MKKLNYHRLFFTIVVGILFFITAIKPVSAVWWDRFFPIRPLPIRPPIPTVIIPTIKPWIPIWRYPRKTPIPTVTPSPTSILTPTSTPSLTPTLTPTITPIFASWKYKKEITINSSKVAADIDDFPVLISLRTDNNLKNHAKLDGSDIIFTDADGNKLPREIEKYDSSTGQLIAWVKSNIKDMADVSIYMLFGNVNANETNSTETWESNFKGVWHMTDVTSLTISDSTINGFTGTKKNFGEPSEIIGKYYKGQDFDGVDDFIAFPNSAIALQPANLTFEAWIYRDTDWSNIDQEVLFFAKTEDSWNSNGWYLMISKQIGAAQGIVLFVDSSSFCRTEEVNPNNLFALNNWTHLVVTWNSDANICKVKINNINKNLIEPFGITDSITGSSSQPKRLGSRGINYPATLDYNIDELRIHSIDRDDNWLTTNYNNQSSPETFYTIGSLTEY